MLDLAAEMLAVGKREIDAAGVSNVVFQLGEADAMPFRREQLHDPASQLRTDWRPSSRAGRHRNAPAAP